jgi:hypothetical protein
VDVEVERFLQGGHRRNHELFGLLEAYRTKQLQMETLSSKRAAIQVAVEAAVTGLWDVQATSITKSGRCGDRVNLTAKQTYNQATYNAELQKVLEGALHDAREAVFQETTQFLFNSILSKLEVDNYLQTVRHTSIDPTSLHSPISCAALF